MKIAKDCSKFIFILFFFPSLLFAQNAIVGTGFSTGWDNGSCNDNSNFRPLGPSGFGGTYILTTTASDTGNSFFRLGVDWGTSRYSVSGAGNAGQNNSVVPNNTYTVNANCDFTGSMFYNVASTSYNYVFKTSAVGTSVGGNKFVFFEIQGPVRTISSVTRDITFVSSSQSPIITANLNGSLSTGQSVYLRYSTDNFATSSILLMTGSGSTYTASIPTRAPGSTVSYYVFTSGNNLTINHSDADLFTINGNTNGGANYSYNISTSYQSRQTGSWGDFNTWQIHNGSSWVNAASGQVPSNTDGAIAIRNGHIVTIGTSVVIDDTTIDLGGRLILSGGTLTINDGSGDDLIINGKYERTSSLTNMTINSGAIVSCEGTGIYEHNVAGGSLPSITWKDGSILKIKNSIQTNLNQSFWDVLVEGGTASAVTTSGDTSRTMTVRNDFKLSGGDFFLKNGGLVGGTHTIRVKGNFIQSGGSFAWNSSPTDNTSIVKIEVEKDLIISAGTWSGNVSATLCECGVFFLGNDVEQTYSTVLVHGISGAVRNRFYYKSTSGPTALHEIYNGTIAQFTINGSCGTSAPAGYSKWPSTGSLLKTMTINNPAGVTLQSTKSVGTTLFLKNGLFNLNSQSFTMTNGSTIDRTGGTISATPTGTSYNVLYSPHNVGLTTDLELPITTTVLNDITINNGNTITLQSNKTVNGNLSIATGVFDIVDKTINRGSVGGTLSIADSAKLKIGGTNSFPTNYTTHGINDNSIVEYAGTSQVIATTNKINDYDYGFLELSGSGTKTLGGVVDVYNDLTINGGNLVVNNGEILRVRDEFKNISGTATFENNSSLVQENDSAINTGDIIYKRTANGVNGYDYVYWSSPVLDQPIGTLYSSPSPGFKYEWNPIAPNPAGSFGFWVSPTSSTMELAKGYIVRASSSYGWTGGSLTSIFRGKPNNGLITPTLSRIANSANINDRWNLIGNPYPSALDAKAFLLENAVTNPTIDGYIALWQHLNAPVSSTSPYYANYQYNYTNDYLIYNRTGLQAQFGFDGYVASGQAFFVNLLQDTSAATSVTFKNSFRSKMFDNSQFLRTSQSEEGRIWVDLVDANNVPVRSLIGYVEGATQERDRLYDAITTIGEQNSIYSLIDNEIFVIQGRMVPFDNNDQVNLGINAVLAGTYKIAVAGVDGFFNQDSPIFLEDKLLNIIHDLRVAPYSFSSAAGKFNARFVLRYTNTALVNPDFGNIENSVIVAANQGELTIKSSIENIQEVTIYDVLGRQLFFAEEINNTHFITSNISLSQQTLIVKIKLENGMTISRKIIL